MIKARIFIMPKAGLLDPQGKVVEKALTNLGFGVKAVSVGKCVELLTGHFEMPKARIAVQEMCDKLLANNLIESYSFDLVQV